jgi:DNA-binding CsgD family transcriptional regulator
VGLEDGCLYILNVQEIFIMEKYSFLNFLKAYSKTTVCKNIPDIIELTTPLRKLGLDYFSATRYDANNIASFFINDDEAIKHYIKNPALFYEEPMSTVTRLLKPGEYYRTEVFKKVPPYTTPAHFKGFNIIQDHENGVRETYYFNIINANFNEYNLLRNFVSEFREKAYKLIEKADKIYIPMVYASANPLDRVTNLSLVNAHLNSGAKDFLTKFQYDYCKCLQVACKHNLSHQEAQCLLLVIQGKLNKQIADILNLSQRTVEAYLSHISYKLGCRGRSNLIIKSLLSVPITAMGPMYTINNSRIDNLDIKKPYVPNNIGDNRYLANIKSYNLSSREAQCLELLLMGKNNLHIADYLNISRRTVELYMNKIKAKLSCHKKIDILIKMVNEKSLNPLGNGETI